MTDLTSNQITRTVEIEVPQSTVQRARQRVSDSDADLETALLDYIQLEIEWTVVDAEGGGGERSDATDATGELDDGFDDVVSLGD